MEMIMSETAMQAALDAVARGIKVLDEHGPKDWRSKIDLDELDMEDGNKCILGQLYREAHGQAESGHGSMPCSDECVCVVEWSPYAYGRTALAASCGITRAIKPGEFHMFSVDHGFADFSMLTSDHDRGDIYVSFEDSDHDRGDIYVSFEDLDNAWRQELSPC